MEEAERALDRQSPILHPMHVITVKTLQQLLYAYIGKTSTIYSWYTLHVSLVSGHVILVGQEVGDWPKALTTSERLTEPHE